MKIKLWIKLNGIIILIWMNNILKYNNINELICNYLSKINYLEYIIIENKFKIIQFINSFLYCFTYYILN